VFAHIQDNKNDDPVLSLRDSEEKYRLLVENVNDSIVISQKDKLSILINSLQTCLVMSMMI